MLRTAAGPMSPASIPRAIGAQPAAEHPHHPADMLAHDDIADADLAQLAVHIVDETLGEVGACRWPVGIAFKPQQDQAQHRGDHIEPAVDAIGHGAVQIPVRRPRARHDRIVKSSHFRAVPTPKQPVDQPHSPLPSSPMRAMRLVCPRRAAY